MLLLQHNALENGKKCNEKHERLSRSNLSLKKPKEPMNFGKKNYFCTISDF